MIDPTYQSEDAAELARKRAFNYHCWDCGHEFTLQITGTEARSALDEGHQEACPGCRQTVGKGRVKCRQCQGELVVSLPHWHACCDLAMGKCPQCGQTYDSACIC